MADETKGNGNEELAKLLAQARAQVNADPNAGNISALEKQLAAVLESNANMSKRIQQIESRSDQGDRLADQVIDGQQMIRQTMQRKGGFHTIDNADVYQRLIDPAGLTMEQKLTMPSRQLRKYLPSDTFERVKIFQELNDDAMIIGWVKATKSVGTSGVVGGGTSVGHFIKDTRTWKALQSVHKALTVAGGLNPTAGAEWMPTSFSSQLVDVITVSLKVADQFTRITIPTNTFKIPIATSDDIAFYVPETTTDNLFTESSVYPKFTPATANVSFNAGKLAAVIVFSEEAEEDSIIPLLDFIKMKIGKAVANAQERATLDGDTTATHMDNDVTVATDARKIFKGMRYQIKTGMSNTLDVSTFNLDNVRALRGLITAAFAENPENLFWVTSVKVMLKMLKFPEFMTIDKYGPNATIVTGEVGKVDGSPVLTSKYSRDDVAATGVNTAGGPNTKSLLYLQNNLGWWYGDRREIRIDSARMIMSGQGFMVVSQRLDMKDIYPSATYKHGALGINI